MIHTQNEQILYSMEGHNKIKDLFSLFHDGMITHHHRKERELRLEIEITYLAERIDPTFTTFQVILSGIDHLHFTTWPNDRTSPPQVIFDVDLMFGPELDILEANLSENLVQVVCNQTSPDIGYCGGELYFSAESAIVMDEAGRPCSREQLIRLCEEYWNDWTNKNKANLAGR